MTAQLNRKKLLKEFEEEYQRELKLEFMDMIERKINRANFNTQEKVKG